MSRNHYLSEQYCVLTYASLSCLKKNILLKIITWLIEFTILVISFDANKAKHNAA